MPCSRSYFTVLYCRYDSADGADDTTPIVEDCAYMDNLDDEEIESSCQMYSADFVIITEYNGIDPVFRIVFEYQPAELVARGWCHYVTLESVHATF